MLEKLVFYLLCFNLSVDFLLLFHALNELLQVLLAPFVLTLFAYLLVFIDPLEDP